MVLAAKIFVVKDEDDLPLLATKLKSFKLEQAMSAEEESFNLVSEISGLEISKTGLEGTFSFDAVFTVNQRGKMTPLVRTYQAPFMFDLYDDNLFLTVFEKKNRANSVANEMSKALFMSLGQIVEAKIRPEDLKRFHEENFDNTKVIFFDDVDLPNISKLSLYGEALGNTTLYNDYLTHGQLWYIVFQSRRQGYTIGLTRSCIVTSFSRVDLPDFKSFIKQEIFPLISA